jgi:polyhydroxyalkanoate synthesis regulator phasin
VIGKKKSGLEIDKAPEKADDVKEAKGKLDALIAHTEKQLQGYGTRIRESEEMGLLRKKYAQLEAHAVLLKAQLAAEKEATYDHAQAYLDEAKAWYARAKEESGEEVSRKIADIEKHIDETKVALKKKTKESRQEIADLLNRAVDIVK